VKGVKQIPLIHFNSNPQATGIEKATAVRPAAAATQSELPRSNNSSKTTSSSSTSSFKPKKEYSHAGAGAQSVRVSNAQASTNRPRCTSSPRRGQRVSNHELHNSEYWISLQHCQPWRKTRFGKCSSSGLDHANEGEQQMFKLNTCLRKISRQLE
jgi:hypothetical protein